MPQLSVVKSEPLDGPSATPPPAPAVAAASPAPLRVVKSEALQQAATPPPAAPSNLHLAPSGEGPRVPTYTLPPPTPHGMAMAGGAVGAAVVPELELPLLGTGAVASMVGAGAGGAAGHAAGGGDLAGAPEAGAEQAALEGFGQLISWPLKAVGRRLLASPVANAVRGKLGDALERAQQLLGGAKEGAASTVNAAKATATAATAEAAARGASGVTAARTNAAADTAAAAEAARQGVRGARTGAAADVAATTQRADALTREPQQAFRTAVPPPSSRPAIQRDVRAAIQGPAKSSLDQLGQAVTASTQSGPPVDFRGVKAAAADMTAATRPAEDPASNLMMPNGQPIGGGTRAALQAKGIDPASLAAAELAHPLNGALSQIQQAPDTVSFEDAHKYKRLLDDAVNWDSPAKKQVQQITKGVRGAVRSSMAAVGHQPYEEATAAYQAAAPLFKPSVVQQLQQTASASPQALTSLVKGTDRTKIQMLKELLLTHAPTGGGDAGAQAGQQAWNSVRSAWTYDHLIQGGVDKFSDRIGKLDPEFVQSMYGDEEGQAVLGRLKTIAEAFDSVKAQGEQDVAQTTTQGAAGVETAKRVGIAGVTATKQQGVTAVGGAQQAATAQTAATRATGTAQVAKAATEGRADIGSARNLVGAVKDKVQAFGRSSLATPPPTATSAAVDAAHVVLHGGSPWTWPAAKRLLSGPKGADLVQWAAYAPTHTQALVRAVTSPVPGQAIADLMRVLGSSEGTVEEPKMAVSHVQAATPPPSAAPAATPPPAR